MKTGIPAPPGTSPEIEKVYRQANQLLHQNQTAQHRIKVQNSIKILIGLCVVLVLFGGVLVVYNNRSDILSGFKGLLPNQTIPKTASPQPECNTLSMTLNGEELKPSVPKIGKCYTIPSGEKFTAWKKVFNEEKNRNIFVEAIGGDKEFVEKALKNSLKTKILDLRDNGAATIPATTSPSPAPTKIPQYAKRDTPLAIEKLVAVMKEQGIGSVAGVSDQRNLSDWKLFYSSDDYLILSLSDMPEACLKADHISVTLQPSEGAMSLGNGWVICQ